MKKGIWYALGAYIAWGLLPIYWKLLAGVPPLQLLGHRIFWSFLLLISVILITRQWKALRAALNLRVLGIYSLTALLIGVNWLIYVWAVGAGFIVETSLGYYINPLLTVLLGVILLRERMRPLQWVPIALAAAGVVYLTVSYGRLPWIALSLAFSFGAYGLIKKFAPLGALQGLTLETGILVLPAVAFLLISEFSGSGAFLHSGTISDLMLVGAGLITIFPLFLFSAAAPRIPLTMIGVLQYVNPTMQFLIGVLVFKEPFTPVRLVGFGFVWIALIFFWLEGYAARRKESVARGGA